MLCLTLNTINSVHLALYFLITKLQRGCGFLHGQGVGLNGAVHSGC